MHLPRHRHPHEVVMSARQAINNFPGLHVADAVRGVNADGRWIVFVADPDPPPPRRPLIIGLGKSKALPGWDDQME